MSFRSDLFKRSRQLQQFVLTDVIPTGRLLGTGSYGSVEEVGMLYVHAKCDGGGTIAGGGTNLQ